MEELEIEIKAYCQNISEVKKKLIELDAVFIKTEKEYDQYYNHPAKDFAETDEALRLRNVADTTILTYKGPKISKATKARIEKEVIVQDDKETGEILQLLGFRQSGIVVKNRDYYQLGEIIICLDDVENLGSFVEIEKKGNDLENIEKELFVLSEKLGLERFERRSYLEMLLTEK